VLLPGRLGELESLAECLARGWPALLVGGPSSGKSSLARMAAALAGWCRDSHVLPRKLQDRSSLRLGGTGKASIAAWPVSVQILSCCSDGLDWGTLADVNVHPGSCGSNTLPQFDPVLHRHGDVLYHTVAGRHLNEVALSAGSDTADLLGGFEQLEPARAAQVPRQLTTRQACT
jgi:hypothetical protein